MGGALASTVQAARSELGFSVAALAEASGVSRAMIAKVERGDAQPTAALLGRIATALGLTLSGLIARAEDGGRLVRRADQPAWVDPETGSVRRALSPAGSRNLELVEIELPPGAELRYPAEAFLFVEPQVWVLDGRLRLAEGAENHELDAGDCVQLGAPVDCMFSNPTQASCRYVVALLKLSTGRRRAPLA
ncbi:LacI family transcriptional regulator [Agromyces aureus]|uniref:LacI family transcriptional regulator n=1 Tax=Agromyces aureus TaxID=453304 RepID=A0A191WKT6_9MICO|nr:LacI family transcriptional regulator [Agromyces aureus]